MANTQFHDLLLTKFCSDWELAKLHELKGRGDVDDASDAPDASTSNTSNTSNAVASGSQQALTKIERASAKVPPVKHDYSAMTAEEAKRAKRQLADARTRAAKQLNLLIQGRIKRMSVSDTGADHFVGNGFMWTIVPQYFAANNLRMLGYPQGEARLPMEEYPSKGASGWRVIERDGLTEALDARGTRNEGLRMESHQYKNGTPVLFVCLFITDFFYRGYRYILFRLLRPRALHRLTGLCQALANIASESGALRRWRGEVVEGRIRPRPCSPRHLTSPNGAAPAHGRKEIEGGGTVGDRGGEVEG